MMKLLMISGDRSLLQGKKGAFYYMLEELHKHWGRIDIICPQEKTTNYKLPVRTDIRPGGQTTNYSNVFLHPSPRGLWYQPLWIAKNGRKLIEEHHHNVMTVHEYPPFYNGLGAEWLSRKTGVPYVLEIHHIVGYPRASSLIEWIGKWMSHLLIVNDTYGARAVRCVNGEVAKTLQRWGAKNDDVFVIPSFYLDPATLNRDASIEKTYDVVSSGRLVPNKGFDDLLRAIAMLPKATLLLIGDGPQRKCLKKMTEKLGIERRVTFAGWLPKNTDVYRAIQTAKIFVMNSRSEGGPRVALEAMALGMPVISTRVGVMSDIIQDAANGIFTTGAPRNLSARIEKLLLYPSLADKLGSDAARMREKFDRETLISQYADFLKRFARV